MIELRFIEREVIISHHGNATLETVLQYRKVTRCIMSDEVITDEWIDVPTVVAPLSIDYTTVVVPNYTNDVLDRTKEKVND